MLFLCRSSPANAFSSVVLPLPGGPNSRVRRPGFSTPVTPFRMVRWCLVDFRMPAEVSRSCKARQQAQTSETCVHSNAGLTRNVVDNKLRNAACSPEDKTDLPSSSSLTNAAYQWCIDEGVSHCGHTPAAYINVCADFQVVELDLNLGQLNTGPTHIASATE